MAGGVYGADIAQLRALAKKLGAAADDLERGQRQLTAGVGAARAWQGPSAERFRSEWATTHAPTLMRTAASLRTASERAERNARQQEDASAATGSASPAEVAGVGAPGQGSVWASAAALGSLALLWKPTAEYLSSIAENVAKYAPGLARFAPRGANGRFVASANGWWAKAVERSSPKNWVSATGKSGVRASWIKVGNAVPWVVAAVDFGVESLGQWNRDADDPSVSPVERVARAGTRGLLFAGGALGGGLAGAKVGAIFGSFAGPVGTAGGAIIGGFVGGLVGRGAAEMVGDGVTSFVGDFADKMTNSVGGAIRTVSSTVDKAVQSVGQKVSEVGKALRFWER